MEYIITGCKGCPMANVASDEVWCKHPQTIDPNGEIWMFYHNFKRGLSSPDWCPLRQEKICFVHKEDWRQTMNIYSQPGDKVRPIFKDGKIQNGYDSQIEHAQKYLEDKEYEIKRINVGDWSTSVILKGVVDENEKEIAFNSVHFRNIIPEL